MSANLPDDEVDDDAARERLRRIFVRVMIVQVVTLALLWLLQARFGL
jgi:hypothetical protein